MRLLRVLPAVIPYCALFSLCAGLAEAAVPRAIDINGDGKIDADDAQAFLDAVAQGSAPALDLDGDGKTGLSDALLYGRWIDGLFTKPAAGLGSLYFQDPADSAAFARYQDDVKAKQAWGLPQLQSAYPDGTVPFAPIAGPIEFESEVGKAFAKFSLSFDTAAFRSKVRSQGMAIPAGPSFPNFFQALDQIHDADLPLLFTSDALLHTLYLSYDSLLAGMEENRFALSLDTILSAAEGYAEAHYPVDASSQDVAELLGTARMLLNPQRSDLTSTPGMAAHLADIKALTEKTVSLWGRDTLIDFSQFKPRGHYTRSARLTAYFQAMMWLSRADLAFDLRANPPKDKEAYTRMKRDAVILWDCLINSGSYPAWLEIDKAIGYMVGQSDGLSPRGMGLVMQSLGITDAQAFAAAFPEARFDSAIAAGRFGAQAILSQAKVINPGDPLDLSPIFSFMPQRFILDAFTFSQLVNPVSPAVPWPSSLQIAFALGDNSALKDLAKTGAAANGVLGAQRALYDGISEAGWQTNLYTGWLGFLRKLNGAESNAKEALVFRSPAWRLKTRNTQLTSWAQLRHNTLLYAKQSYTGGVTCDFPKAYVEPYPEFFAGVAAYAKNGAAMFRKDARAAAYFASLGDIAGRLQAIAARSAQGLGPDSSQSEWLRAALTYKTTPLGCAPIKVYDGWFLDLIYASARTGIDGNTDATIADVHTKPYSDEIGQKGVLHVGSGPIRLAAVAIQSDSCVTLYAAPVSSFYEVLRLGTLDRMTDEVWKDSLRTTSAPSQPDWIKPILSP
jgi:hypothetical protein